MSSMMRLEELIPEGLQPATWLPEIAAPAGAMPASAMLDMGVPVKEIVKETQPTAEVSHLGIRHPILLDIMRVPETPRKVERKVKVSAGTTTATTAATTTWRTPAITGTMRWRVLVPWGIG